MPLACDSSKLRTVIRQQQRKVCAEMQAIVKQKATNSAYPALGRREKRQAEYHSDRVAQEKALQRDLTKAGRMAARIALVLEKVRKDLSRLKSQLGDYNFASTIGMDSSADADCATDLSGAIDTRASWKRDVCNRLMQIRNYVNQQSHGDYTVGWNPADTGIAPIVADPCSPLSQVDCCPLVYRSVFHYFTPLGDCLKIAPEAGSHSGDATVAGFSASADSKSAPQSNRHNQVSNCDLDMEQMYQLLCYEDVRLLAAVGGHQATVRDTIWLEYLKSIVAGVATTRVAVRAACLPPAMVDALAPSTAVTNDFTYRYIDGTLNVAAVAAVIINYDDAMANAPTIQNVEDESDLTFILKFTVARLEFVRLCQHTNDREQEVLEYVREASECNQAFHEEVFDELTDVDTTELCERYKVGKEMLSDLDGLYRETCVTKQTFFTDITVDGCCCMYAACPEHRVRSPATATPVSSLLSRWIPSAGTSALFVGALGVVAVGGAAAVWWYTRKRIPPGSNDSSGGGKAPNTSSSQDTAAPTTPTAPPSAKATPNAVAATSAAATAESTRDAAAPATPTSQATGASATGETGAAAAPSVSRRTTGGIRSK